MSAAAAAPCPGNPEAIGVSRVLSVNARDYSRVGRMQYRHSLPLDDREVVLTFDDGPLPPYTDRVLEILARHCVKATFFLVGRHVAANPAAARRVLAAGHTVGNHSQNHSPHFAAIAPSRAEQEVDTGFRSIALALGGAEAVAPFFRVPGLNRTSAVENYVHARDGVVWSADTVADDWRRISATEVLRLALSRLEARGRGILLLHDIQPRTVLMLPALLAELKRRHFRIVHVVSDGVSDGMPDRDGSPPAPPVEVAAPADELGWPRIVTATAAPAAAEPVAAEPGIAESRIADASSLDPVPMPPRRKLKSARRHAKAHARTIAAVDSVPAYSRSIAN